MAIGFHAQNDQVCHPNLMSDLYALHYDTEL